METREKKDYLADVAVCIVSAVIVALAFHCFSNRNNFAPGGINGLASMVGYLTGVNMGYYSVYFNLPIFALVFLFVNRKTGLMLTVYIVAQALALILFEKLNFWYYETQTNLIYASVATGVVSGLGFAIMLRRFGASGGTYAISALIKRAKPESNIAWVAFAMDSSVVVLSFFVYGFQVEPVIGTLINLFIANYVVDFSLQGLKQGYKLEVVTTQGEELAAELLTKTGHGVTRIEVTGMYSHEGKSLLVCIVRKRHIGEFMRIIKNYPATFSYISRVSEVFGNFRQ